MTWLGQTKTQVVHYKDLLVGSISLIGTSAVLGIAGFLFWVVVARFYPIVEVGHATALVSVIILLSTIGVFGLGTVLIGQLSLDPRRADPLLPAALGVAVILSALMAGLFAFGVTLLPSSALNRAFDNDWSTYVIFIVSVAVSSAAGVFDQASLGLRASHIQFLRNAVMSVARLVAVVALAILWGRTANSLLVAWTAAVVFSIFVIVWPMRRRDIRFMRLRSPRHLRGLVVHTAHHTTLNMALSIPRLIMPIIVAAFAGGITTAVFYVCWMIAMFLYTVPTALSTTLFVIAVGDAPETDPGDAIIINGSRFSLRAGGGFRPPAVINIRRGIRGTWFNNARPADVFVCPQCY
jgi:O-antigen/teichoic acid export membrane protein